MARSTSGMTVAAELVDAEILDEKLVIVDERENEDDAEPGRPEAPLCRTGGTM